MLVVLNYKGCLDSGIAVTFCCNGDYGIRVEHIIVNHLQIHNRTRLTGGDGDGGRDSDTTVFCGCDRECLGKSPHTATTESDRDTFGGILLYSFGRKLNRKLFADINKTRGGCRVVDLGRIAFTRLVIWHKSHLQAHLSVDAEEERQSNLYLTANDSIGIKCTVVCGSGDLLCGRTVFSDQ